MAVKFMPFGLSGGVVEPAQFSDTFNRANGGLGLDWISAVLAFGATVPIDSAFAQIAASALDGNQCLRYTTLGAINPLTYYRGRYLPVDLIHSTEGKNQFSEIQIVRHALTAGAGNSVDAGCGVLMNLTGQSYQGYHLTVRANDGIYILKKWIDANVATQTNLLVGAAASYGNGDILRLEVRFTSAQLNFLVMRNGVTIDSVTDSAANRFTTGSVGLAFDELGNTAGETYTSEWRNYQGGVL